jgi:modulator of FtsH protease HflK
MPWSQNGGGWKAEAGGPWWQGGSQEKLRQAIPRGAGFLGNFVIFVIVAAALAWFGFTVRVNPDERAVVQRFGKLDRELGAGLNFCWPYPIEEVTVIPYTRQNRAEIGFSLGSGGQFGSLHNPSKPDESLMLTGDENVVDVNFSVFWNVKDARAYLFSMRNPGNNPDANANNDLIHAAKNARKRLQIHPVACYIGRLLIFFIHFQKPLGPPPRLCHRLLAITLCRL